MPCTHPHIHRTKRREMGKLEKTQPLYRSLDRAQRMSRNEGHLCQVTGNAHRPQALTFEMGAGKATTSMREVALEAPQNIHGCAQTVRVRQCQSVGPIALLDSRCNMHYSESRTPQRSAAGITQDPKSLHIFTRSLKMCPGNYRGGPHSARLERG